MWNEWSKHWNFMKSREIDDIDILLLCPLLANWCHLTSNGKLGSWWVSIAGIPIFLFLGELHRRVHGIHPLNFTVHTPLREERTVHPRWKFSNLWGWAILCRCKHLYGEVCYQVSLMRICLGSKKTPWVSTGGLALMDATTIANVFVQQKCMLICPCHVSEINPLHISRWYSIFVHLLSLFTVFVYFFSCHDVGGFCVMSFRLLHPSAVIYSSTSRHVQPNFGHDTRCRDACNYDQLHTVCTCKITNIHVILQGDRVRKKMFSLSNVCLLSRSRATSRYARWDRGWWKR